MLRNGVEAIFDDLRAARRLGEFRPWVKGVDLLRELAEAAGPVRVGTADQKRRLERSLDDLKPIKAILERALALREPGR